MAELVTIGGTGGSLFVGEDKIINFHVVDEDGVPVDISLWGGGEIHFYVRVTDSTADPPILDKTGSVVGIYNPSVSVNTQRARITLSEADTNLFRPGRAYRHSLARVTTGAQTVLAWGDFLPQGSTTH
jgi:hypothetical protein